MSPATTLAGFALVLSAVFGAGLALGELVGPVGTAGESGPGPLDPDHTEMDMTR